MLRYPGPPVLLLDNLLALVVAIEQLVWKMDLLAVAFDLRVLNRNLLWVSPV